MEGRALLPLVEVHPRLPPPAEPLPGGGGDAGLCGVNRDPADRGADGAEADQADLRDGVPLLLGLGDDRGARRPHRGPASQGGTELMPCRTLLARTPGFLRVSSCRTSSFDGSHQDMEVGRMPYRWPAD